MRDPVVADFVVSLIDTADGLAALEADWRRLEDDPSASGHFYQGFDFIKLAFGAAGGGRPIVAIASRRGGGPDMILPLVINRRAGLKIASWMGGPFVAAGDAVCAPGVDIDAAGQAIAAALRRAGAADLLLLRYVPESAAAAAWLKRRAAATIPHGPAPFLRLDQVDSYRALYETRISKSLRSQRARKRRRLADLGPLTLDIAAASPAALAQLQVGLAQKRAWAAERGLQSAMLNDPVSVALMTACATAHPGFVCYTMRAGSESLGFVLGLKGRGQVIFLITAFNTAHERYSPGQIMLEDLVAHWHGEGLAEIDFGNGLNAYKLEWTDAAVAHADYAVALTAAGLAYAYGSLRVIQPVVRGIYFALPDQWRRRIMAVLKRGG